MPDWATFAGFAGVVLTLLLLLARASQSALTGEPSPAVHESDRFTPHVVDPGVADVDPKVDISEPDRSDPEHDHWTDRMHATQPKLSTAALLANVAVSQGAFGLLLLFGAWLTEIPPAAFGVSASAVSATALAVGLLFGGVLYLANEAGAAVGERFGLHASEDLREALTPDSLRGWVVLLFVVLPIIAGFEELLFRGALVGVLAAGFGVSPWLLAALSSVAFALGHGAQGPAGVIVTGLLGFALAAAFVVTGSLLVVIVAHYLVNALEFLVHEGVGVDWG